MPRDKGWVVLRKHSAQTVTFVGTEGIKNDQPGNCLVKFSIYGLLFLDLHTQRASILIRVLKRSYSSEHQESEVLCTTAGFLADASFSLSKCQLECPLIAHPRLLKLQATSVKS